MVTRGIHCHDYQLGSSNCLQLVTLMSHYFVGDWDQRRIVFTLYVVTKLWLHLEREREERERERERERRERGEGERQREREREGGIEREREMERERERERENEAVREEKSLFFNLFNICILFLLFKIIYLYVVK